MAYTVSSPPMAKPAGGLSARRLRLIAFFAISAFMVGGPVAEQIGGLNSRYIRSWIMFSGPGIGIVDASFTIRRPDGTFARLDRFDTLGEPRNGKMRRIGREELTEIITRLCAAKGLDADIRVVARLAVRKGWRTLETGEQNVCAR